MPRAQGQRSFSCFCLTISVHFSSINHQAARSTIGVSILKFVLPLLYFALVWTYGKAFFSDTSWAKRWKAILLPLTIGVHAVYFVLRTIALDHPPVTTVFDILSVLAFAVALTYAMIERQSKAKETGYFILNISFFFQLASTLFVRDSLEVPDIMRSAVFAVHITSALIGYAAITISAVYGLLYLMLYHEIKASHFGVIYKKLPTLQTLERMNFIAICLAFAFLMMAIVAGFFWAQQVFSNFSYADPKLLGTAALWLIYGIGILLRMKGTLRGRTIMVLSIVAFLTALFSMSAINLFLSEFHRFN